MVNNVSTVLQIVPRLPGGYDGVGDYALKLARNLSEHYGITSSFATASEIESARQNHEHVILHYVNYGYQKRGVPFRLLSTLRQLRGSCRGRFITIFHELYASAPPWRSAFWLRPWQRHVARSISTISDACVVSSETMFEQLRQLNPEVRAGVHPVPSNFGEPSLSLEQISNRDPHRWCICGGTALVEQSVRSFRAIVSCIPKTISPGELFVVGGNDNPAVHSTLANLPHLRSTYHPQIDAAAASRILSACSFGWLDYFHRADIPKDAVLKSTAFGAFCAHGIVPIFPHRGSSIGIRGDQLPGPYFVDSTHSELPEKPSDVSTEIYAWYRRGVASEHLAHGIAGALGLVPDAVVHPS